MGRNLYLYFSFQISEILGRPLFYWKEMPTVLELHISAEGTQNLNSNSVLQKFILSEFVLWVFYVKVLKLVGCKKLTPLLEIILSAFLCPETSNMQINIFSN